MRASVFIFYVLYTLIVSDIKVEIPEKMKLMLLLSIALGIHSIQHAHDEFHYDINPLAAKFDYTRDEPIR